jgi:hypothetical protein
MLVAPLLPPSSGLDLVSLSLLHHFMTVTCCTISAGPVLQSIWRVTVPRIAYTRPFLMHALLAVSALHVSVLQVGNSSSRTRYELIATTHYIRASEALRHALPGPRAMLPNIDEGKALFVVSGLMMLYMVASSQLTNEPTAAPNPLTWIPLLKGMRTILRGWWGLLETSELSPLLRLGGGQWGREWAGPGEATAASSDRHQKQNGLCLPELPEYIHTLHLPGAETPDPEEVHDTAVSNVYKEAAARLKEAWGLASSADPRVPGVFFWPSTVPVSFLNLLTEGRSRALVFLAHYCAMCWTRCGHWWLSEVHAAGEIDAIERMLDVRWRAGKWLDWPRSVIARGARGGEEKMIVSVK